MDRRRLLGWGFCIVVLLAGILIVGVASASITLSNPSPNGGEIADSFPVDLEIDIDTDNPTLDLKWRSLNGEQPTFYDDFHANDRDSGVPDGWIVDSQSSGNFSVSGSCPSGYERDSLPRGPACAELPRAGGSTSSVMSPGQSQSGSEKISSYVYLYDWFTEGDEFGSGIRIDDSSGAVLGRVFVASNGDIVATDSAGNSVTVASGDYTNQWVFLQLIPDPADNEYTVVWETQSNSGILSNIGAQSSYTTYDNIDVYTSLSDSYVDEFTIGELPTIIDAYAAGTTSAPGTWVTEWDDPESGLNSWQVRATDRDGEEMVSGPHTFQVPGSIDLYYENRPNDQIDETVEATFYGENGEVYTRETSDGELSITGMTNQRYTISFESNFIEPRTVIIEDFSDLRPLFLIEETSTVDTVQSQFVLNDVTGTYDSESELVFRRSLEHSGTGDSYQIHADTFGTEGVTATFIQGARYTVSIRDSDGTSQTLGPYRATNSEVVTIEPDADELDTDTERTWFIGQAWNNDSIRYGFQDPRGTVDYIDVEIYERNDPTNVIWPSTRHNDPTDVTVDVPVGNASYTAVVNYTIVLDSGEQITIERLVSPNPNTVPTSLDPVWQNAIAITVILTFGLAFSVLNRAVGAIVLALVGGALWWVGWLAGATAGVLVIAYLFIAIGYAIFTKSIR